MNKNELNAALERCFTEDANVEVYLGIKEKGFRKARFENDVQKKVASMYQTELAEKLLKNDEANLTAYSAYEGRTKDWAEFDLEMPEDLNFFDELMRHNEVEGFSFEDDGLDNIESMVIVIGNAEARVGIYKRMASINIFTKNKGLFVRKGDNGFVSSDINFLRITNGIDLMKINGSLLIANISVLEKYFNITDVVSRAATSEIGKIAELGIVSDTAKLTEIAGELRYARKLAKISETSPVIRKGISAAQIRRFAGSFQYPQFSTLRFDEEDRLCLTSKKSAQIFIKLLNDDYLSSELTESHYDSAVKEEVHNDVRE